MKDKQLTALDNIFNASKKFDITVLGDDFIRDDEKLKELATDISNLIGELYQAVVYKD